MNKFILNIILFFSPILIFVVVIIGFFTFGSDKLEAVFKVDDRIENIIIGDSHSTLAMNDSLIKNTKSFANYSESYIFNYYKLKIIHKLNPNVKNVLLSVGCHNFAKYYDKFTLNSDLLGRYFVLFPFKDQVWLLNHSNNKISLLKYAVYYGAMDYLVNDSMSYQGGYNNIVLEKVVDANSIEKRINRQYGDLDLNDFKSDMNIKYFHKIIEYCKKNNLNLILFKTPLYSGYNNKIPDVIKDEYAKITKGMTILQYDSLFESDKRYFMPDGDHLKIIGANKFSKLVDDYLNN